MDAANLPEFPGEVATQFSSLFPRSWSFRPKTYLELMPLPRNDKCREILASNASCKFKVLLLHDLQIMV
jgi:hypothetical protein